MIDLLVVGGGPVGLAAAIEGARRGMRVVVLEPRADPADKACGEGLMPPAVRALARLGVPPLAGIPFRGIRYLDAAAGAEAVAVFRSGDGLGVRRTTLRMALKARAEALGVRVEPARASEIVQGDDWVEAAGVRARWLIAADGLHSAVRKRLGVEVRPRGQARGQGSTRERLGVRAHFRVAPWTDVVEVHWERSCEAYVTPVAPDEVGVAILHSERGARFDALLARFPALVERLGPQVAPPQGAGPFHVYARRVAVGRVLLVGDAAGFLDPLTGEGIRLGLASSALAIDAIARGQVATYDRAWRRLVRRYWWVTSALLAIGGRPWLRRRLVPICARVPRLFSFGLSLLADDERGGVPEHDGHGRGTTGANNGTMGGAEMPR